MFTYLQAISQGKIETQLFQIQSIMLIILLPLNKHYLIQ